MESLSLEVFTRCLDMVQGDDLVIRGYSDSSEG